MYAATNLLESGLNESLKLYDCTLQSAMGVKSGESSQWLTFLGLCDIFLQEVNLPRHASRYSDLPPVDISNESFQKLAFKPRTKEAKSGKKTVAGKETATVAPSIMELYPATS